MRTEVARGSTGKLVGTLKTISCSSASAGSAVALSEGALSKYVVDADGTAGADGEGEALADSELVGAGVDKGEGDASGDAELSGAGFPLRTSAIDGAT